MEAARNSGGSGAPAPPIERSLARKVLPTVLSLIAASVDAISGSAMGKKNVADLPVDTLVSRRAT